MQNNRFHFFSYRPAIRFHIANQLMARGWEKTENPKEAIFNDKHLTLNDEVSKNLEYKHLLAQLMAKYCPHSIPVTYHITDNNYREVLAKIRYQHYLPTGESKQKDLKWILKPSMLNNGDFIKLFNHVEEIKKHYETSNRLGGSHVVQQYLSSPDLIEGRKYTFRVAGVFTNYAGIFLYKEGYVNISAHPFTLEDNMQNRKVHITNYLLEGELSHIEQRSTQQLENFPQIYQQMCEIVRCVIKALLKKEPTYLKRHHEKVFEIFGFDFILDAQGKLWLIEINQGPDAPTFEENRLDKILWQPFWQDIIEEFVLPIALETPPKKGYAHFTQVLSPKACYSRGRAFFAKIIGKNTKNDL